MFQLTSSVPPRLRLRILDSRYRLPDGNEHPAGEACPLSFSLAACARRQVCEYRPRSSVAVPGSVARLISKREGINEEDNGPATIMPPAARVEASRS